MISIRLQTFKCPEKPDQAQRGGTRRQAVEISGSPSADGGFCWQQTKLKIRLAWSWNAENEVQKKDQYIYKSFRTKCVFVSVLLGGGK